MDAKQFRAAAPLSAAAIGLAVAKLVLHLVFINGYGIFRDELYYVATSKHLSWCFVDFPPLAPALLRIVRMLFGDSLFAIRLLPAMAGAATVLLAALIARELGGGRFAQALAALAVFASSFYLVVDHIFNTNAFEPLFWMAGAWIAVRFVNTRDRRLWLWFGVVAGLGLMNKHSMLFFGLALAIALLLTRERSVFLDRRIWLGGAIAALIYAPALVWQALHGWPQLALLHNVEQGKNYMMGPAEFFVSQILLQNPATAPLWLGGLWFLFTRAGKPYRVLAWTYLGVFVMLVALHGKAYYLAAAYPMLFAAGAVGFERLAAWTRPVYAALLACAGIVFAPLMLPVLPVETYIRYANFLGIREVKMENHKQGRLPQLYADMFGWREMAAEVARVVHTLPPEDQSRAVVFARNYGEAGALQYYGPQYGMPPVICPHVHYWIWGPGDHEPEVLIVIGGNPADAHKVYAQVELMGRIANQYAMPYENQPIWVCRKRYASLLAHWPALRVLD